MSGLEAVPWLWLAHHPVARAEHQVGVAGARHRQEIGDVPGVVDTGSGLER